MAKSGTLQKFADSFVDKICEQLIETSSLKKDQKSTIRIKTSDEELATLREDAIKQFKTSNLERIQKVIEEESVNEKLDELRKLRAKRNKNELGWRPTDDPAQDTFGERRLLLVQHISRLGDLKRSLEDRLQQMDMDCTMESM